MTQQNPIAANHAMFKLEYPQSLGVFATYADAQKAVDHLADNNFPVGNLAIVGTDLRLVERVTGRRTWGTVLGQGVMSGLSTGFIVGIFMMILFPSNDFLGQLLTALLIGVAIGLLFAVLGYALSRGQRDFTSVTQTIATKYEVLCEHKVVGQARELLAQAPGARAAQFNPSQGQGPGYPQAPGYPQQQYPAPGYPQQPPGYPYPQGPQQNQPQQNQPQQRYPQQGQPQHGQPQHGQPGPQPWGSAQGWPPPPTTGEAAPTASDPDGPYRPPAWPSER